MKTSHWNIGEQIDILKRQVGFWELDWRKTRLEGSRVCPKSTKLENLILNKEPLKTFKEEQDTDLCCE